MCMRVTAKRCDERLIRRVSDRLLKLSQTRKTHFFFTISDSSIRITYESFRVAYRFCRKHRGIC